VLLDKRADTYIATSATAATSLQVDLGKMYTVTKVSFDYENRLSRRILVSVFDQTGKKVGSGSLLPKRRAKLEIPLLRVVASGPYGKRIPVGQNFRIQLPKGQGAKLLDLSFHGGSDPVDVSATEVAVTWGLAVVVDFANSNLEDYNATSDFNNVHALRRTLDRTDSHWRWVS
jgi:hypothetical protein